MSTADWQTEYRHVLSALAGFHDYGSGRGRATCPCHHPDGDADLWLSVGDQGQLIVRCYPRRSGSPACRTADVMARLGQPLTALFPDFEARDREFQARKAAKQTRPIRTTSPGGRPMRDRPNEPSVTEAEYEYFDPDQPDKDGKPRLAYVVVKKRYQGGAKDYPQKRPNPDFDRSKRESKDNPAWVWTLAGVKKILFGLPELRAALAENRDRYVFLVEGEEDVRTARKMGMVATSHPGGALKWTLPQFTAELKGCNVVLIADEDPVFEDVNKPGSYLCPGIDHVRDVAAKLLAGGAQSVRLFRLPDVPEFGDLSDWRRVQVCSDDEARGRLGKLVKETARVIATPEDIAGITPRGEPVWPIPAGGVPASQTVKTGGPLPAPAPPKPEQTAPPRPTTVKTVAESRREQAAGKTAAPPPEQPAPAVTAPAPARPDGADHTAAAKAFVAKAEVTAALKVLTENDPALAQLVATVLDVRRAAPHGPKSAGEWAGEVWFALASFQAALVGLSKGHGGAAKQATLLLAAQLARGLDAVPELK